MINRAIIFMGRNGPGEIQVEGLCEGDAISSVSCLSQPARLAHTDFCQFTHQHGELSQVSGDDLSNDMFVALVDNL